MRSTGVTTLSSHGNSNVPVTQRALQMVVFKHPSHCPIDIKPATRITGVSILNGHRNSNVPVTPRALQMVVFKSRLGHCCHNVPADTKEGWLQQEDEQKQMNANYSPETAFSTWAGADAFLLAPRAQTGRTFCTFKGVQKELLRVLNKLPRPRSDLKGNPVNSVETVCAPLMTLVSKLNTLPVAACVAAAMMLGSFGRWTRLPESSFASFASRMLVNDLLNYDMRKSIGPPLVGSSSTLQVG